MVNIKAFTFFFLIAFVIGVSAAPGNTTQLPPNPAGSDVTADDILNAPAVIIPLADPSFEPINGGSNATIMKIVPTFASIVQNLPSITASIASELATATGVPTGTPKARREPDKLNKRIDINNINCNWEFNTPNPAVTWNIWQAAIKSACRTWFDDAAHTSPTVYLIEGSFQGPMPVGPPNYQFHFSYHVRSDTCQQFPSYIPTTSDKCIAELTVRTLAAWSDCLGDWSGYDSSPDLTAPIWYTLESPK